MMLIKALTLIVVLTAVDIPEICSTSPPGCPAPEVDQNTLLQAKVDVSAGKLTLKIVEKRPVTKDWDQKEVKNHGTNSCDGTFDTPGRCAMGVQCQLEECGYEQCGFCTPGSPCNHIVRGSCKPDHFKDCISSLEDNCVKGGKLEGVDTAAVNKCLKLMGRAHIERCAAEWVTMSGNSDAEVRQEANAFINRVARYGDLMETKVNGSMSMKRKQMEDSKEEEGSLEESLTGKRSC